MKGLICITLTFLLFSVNSFSKSIFLKEFLSKEKLDKKIENYTIVKGEYDKNDPNSLIKDGVIKFEINDVSYEIKTNDDGRVDYESQSMSVSSYEALCSLIEHYKLEGLVTEDKLDIGNRNVAL